MAKMSYTILVYLSLLVLSLTLINMMSSTWMLRKNLFNKVGHIRQTLDISKYRQQQLKSSFNGTFKILYGSVFHFRKSNNNWFGLGSWPFYSCKYQNCLLTNDSSDYNSSDAVLFYPRHTKSVPSYRFPWQKWIWRTQEAPIREKNFTRFDRLFNVSWTYHSKSDIHTDVFRWKFIKLDEDTQLPMVGNTSGKRLVAWFVSNCKGVPSQRMKLTKALQKYVQVDIYGKCGPLKCGKRMDSKCDKKLGQNYKFYLSFENSLCEEYVTEKLWRAYLSGVVPIVMGAFNYSDYLPSHSYIDVGWFGTVKALADYLILLDKNDTLYREYHEWRKHYRLAQYEPEPCVLCEYLNTHVNMTKVYNKLNSFWNKRTDCFLPMTYYKSLFKDLDQHAQLYDQTGQTTKHAM